MSRSDDFKAASDKAKRGGAPKYHESNAAAGKLFCRERIALLCDDGGKDFIEDGLLANATAGDLPSDGVVTGIGRVHGRPVGRMEILRKYSCYSSFTLGSSRLTDKGPWRHSVPSAVLTRRFLRFSD